MSGKAKIIRTLCLALWTWSVTAALFALPSHSGDKTESVNVGYRFEKGHSDEYKFELSQEYEFKGHSFFTLFDIEFGEKCEENANDSLFKMIISINKVSATFKRNNEIQDISLDEQMMNQSFAFNISSRGIVSELECEGYLEDEEEVMSLIKLLLISSYPYLPDSSLAEEGEWSFEGNTVKEEKSNTSMAMESTAGFKVEEFKKEKGKNCAKIKTSAEIYMHGRIENEAGRFIIDGNGMEKGEAYFDISGGRIIKMKSQVEAEVTAVDASGTAAAKREVNTLNIVYNMKKELK